MEFKPNPNYLLLFDYPKYLKLEPPFNGVASLLYTRPPSNLDPSFGGVLAVDEGGDDAGVVACAA